MTEPDPATMTAEEWNAKHPVGTPVRYHPIQGVIHQSRDTVTRSAAWTVCGSVLVMVEGTSGGVAVDHLVPTPAPSPTTPDARLARIAEILRRGDAVVTSDMLTSEEIAEIHRLSTEPS